MRVIIGFVMISFCLTGCSELQVIGNAAIRELRADAIAVNWNKTEQTQAEKAARLEQVASANVKTFSSFRSSSKGKKPPVKGLWEQHGT